MKKLGILGGGQLGRMLLQAAANYPVETHVLESDLNCPAANLCHHFHTGDIRAYDSVLAFGRQVDVLTIEIEQVNVEALEQLDREGKQVIPHPSVLRIIQNKIRQKEFYQTNGIPTAPFVITQNQTELTQYLDWLPAVHKLGLGGYDGRGVVVLNNESDLPKAFSAPSVLEQKIDIRQEIAILVAVDQQLRSTCYPAVEMRFDQKLNLLDYQICPASIKTKIEIEAIGLANQVVAAFGSPGLFAVELFVDASERVWINEIAPRVHNSGHHTIEAHFSSQFDMLCRIMLGYPLGNPDRILPSAMINLVGADGSSGPAVYEGLEQALAMPHAFVHIYGKRITKPGRKMGHITLLHADAEILKRDAERIKERVRVVASK